MTRVDFYLLEQQAAAAVYPFACRLLEKIYAQNHSGVNPQVFVVLNNLTECETFNKLIWTFHDISFIPHCLATDPVAAHTSIHLGTISQLNNHKMILNLTHETLTNLSVLQRIMEIVPSETEWRQISRQKYLAYKTQLCELYTHKIL